MTELAVLQAVRLKGRVTPADLAATLGEEPDDITETVEQLTESGLLVDGTTLRISPSGRARLETLLAEEREGIDAAVIAAAYHDFRAVNADFKALVTDWQLKGGPQASPTPTMTPNTTRRCWPASTRCTHGWCRSSTRPPRSCHG